MFVYAVESQQQRWFIGVKRTKMKIQMPEDVGTIIQKLNEYGYEAYAVGGCVRDSIIRRVPGDWDITTNARPEQVKDIFKRTIDTGIKHGTVTVMMHGVGYEITTYRIDGEYEDSRHPKTVEFTSKLSEDLMRRDFTINAMAYNDTTGIVDLYDGEKDIENKIIRCVGNAKERFTEDALRMLRAVRFSAQLGYTIEENTANAIKELAPTIANISKERIHTELNKTLLSDNPEYLKKALELGITEVVFPVMNRLTDLDQAMKMLKSVPKDLVFRYVSIMYQLGEKATREMLKELKLDNYTIDTTTKLVSLHGISLTDDMATIRKQASKIGRDMYEMLMIFEQQFYNVVGDTDSLNKCIKQDTIFKGILERKECLTLKELAVTGNDLITAGVKPGKEMGMILNAMLDDVLINPKNNTKEYLFANHLHI